MQNIMIVAESRSYLLMSIKERLRAVFYGLIEVRADTDAIHEVKEPVNCIIIYCDEELIGNPQPLYFLKDRSIMDNIPIVIIGTSAEANAVKAVIPQSLVRFEFLRPINVRDVVEKVDSFLKQHSMQIRKKILVVDDSGDMLRDVKSWLEDKYDVSLANSGAMTIKYLTLNRPDLVLLDYEMPVCDGKQVLEMIRSEADFADIPVVFLTAKGDKQHIMSVMDLKPEGYLLKTLEPFQVVKAVDDFFNAQKAMI